MPGELGSGRRRPCSRRAQRRRPGLHCGRPAGCAAHLRWVEHDLRGTATHITSQQHTWRLAMPSQSAPARAAVPTAAAAAARGLAAVRRRTVSCWSRCCATLSMSRLRQMGPMQGAYWAWLDGWLRSCIAPPGAATRRHAAALIINRLESHRHSASIVYHPPLPATAPAGPLPSTTLAVHLTASAPAGSGSLRRWRTCRRGLEGQR